MLTRRGLLGAVGVLGAGSVAGCVGDDGGGGMPAGTTIEPESPFAGVSFSGPDLVVRLVEDNGLTGVNLIAADGSLFAQAAVEPGVTTVRLPILEITPVNWVHYTPGVHELVAVAGEEAVASMALEMRPALEVVDVRQYRAGEGADYGRIEVEIENLGTGPTWVYQVTYEGTPNWTANDELSEDPGLGSMIYPKETNDRILLPTESQQFVDGSPPLLFRNDNPTCDFHVKEFSVVVGQPVESPLYVNVSANISGDPIAAGLSDEYTCSEITISR